MKTAEEMIERQRVLANFGEFALGSDDLQEVLTEACRLVVEALDAEFAKVVEIQEGGERLLVRAGIGWKAGVVGHKQLPMGAQTSETHAIDAKKPVITRDIRDEERFSFPEFMREHGVIAIVNVPIFVPGGQAYGLLQVDSVEPREFDEEDVEFLRTYAMTLGPVIDRLHKMQDLRSALDAKQKLLIELQHRIRNNISVISTLVRMRADRTASGEAAAELAAVGQRIETLRLLHDQLYAAGAADRLQLRPYIGGLLENLVALYKGQSGPVRLDIEIGGTELSPEAAVPLGLIVNEFATNSLKYAFDGRGGVIAARVEALQGDRIRLHLADDGKGLPAHPSAAAAGFGTGLGLIEGLARQIGAEPEWSSSPNGTTLDLEFIAG